MGAARTLLLVFPMPLVMAVVLPLLILLVFVRVALAEAARGLWTLAVPSRRRAWRSRRQGEARAARARFRAQMDARMAEIVAEGQRQRAEQDQRERAEFNLAADRWLAAHPGEYLPPDFADTWAPDEDSRP